MIYMVKNLIEITNNRNRCYCCSKTGFFSSTPSGADYRTCPICSNSDYYSQNYKMFDDDKDYGQLLDYDYCDRCNIVFEIGCTHMVLGCTDDYYNGHIIGEWEYKGEHFIGSPQFENVEEWIKEFNNIKIIKWVCLNNGWTCTSKIKYNIKEYPQYYYKCSL